MWVLLWCVGVSGFSSICSEVWKGEILLLAEVKAFPADLRPTCLMLLIFFAPEQLIGKTGYIMASHTFLCTLGGCVH